MEFGDPFTVKIEWRIENYTCWESAIHPRVIDSPHCASLPDFKASLGGSPGMKVSCSFGKNRPSEGEVSFFGADQSLVRTEPIRGVEGPIVVPVPSLLEVAERLRDVHGDHIVLRFQFVVPGEELVLACMCTTFEVVSDIFLQYTASELIGDYQLDEPELLLAVTYNRPREDGTTVEEVVHLEKLIHHLWIVLVLEFRMRPVTNWAFHNILMKSSLKLFDRANTLTWWDSSWHLFDRVSYFGKLDFMVFNDDLVVEQLSDEGSRVDLRFQFISGEIKSSVKSVVREKARFVPSDRRSPSNLPASLDTNENPSVLGKELVCLFRNKQFADFELRCGSSTFAAHRAILSARSPVFNSMLSNDMREASAGSVDIEDLDATTCEQFLTFLYTGTIDSLEEESAFKLYYAASKYQVPTLKTECAKFLSGNISVGNVCEVLSLADKHEDEQLTTSAQNFIMKHFGEVSKSEEWQRYMLADPHLLVKTITLIAAKGCFSFIRSRKP